MPFRKRRQLLHLFPPPLGLLPRNRRTQALQVRAKALPRPGNPWPEMRLSPLLPSRHQATQFHSRDLLNLLERNPPCPASRSWLLPERPSRNCIPKSTRKQKLPTSTVNLPRNSPVVSAKRERTRQPCMSCCG